LRAVSPRNASGVNNSGGTAAPVGEAAAAT